MPDTEPAEQSGSTRTYRQGSGVAAGGVLIGLALIYVLIYLLTDRGRGIEPVLWAGAFALALFAMLLRPSVRLSATGVTLRNILRDVHLSWSAIDLIETRWALTAVAHDGRVFQSWAISAQRPKRAARSSSTGALSPLQGLNPFPDPGRSLEDREASAGRVGVEIRETVEQYERGVQRGHIDEQPVDITVRPAVLSLAALALAIGCVVVALVL